jgi:hypothetical protein
MFLFRMPRIDTPLAPVLDSQLAHSIAGWVKQVPDHVLVELAIDDRRGQAAELIGELIVAAITMQYPQLVESVAPPLPF